jgi:L-ascorbate metabolism protein UlaG (beta-lactamase superfamily)
MSQTSVHAVSVAFHPQRPLGALRACENALAILMDAGWEPRLCHERLSRYCEQRGLGDLLDVNALETGGMLARDRLLCPTVSDAWSLVLREPRPGTGAAVRIERAGVRPVAALLRLARRSGPPEVWPRICGDAGLRFANECAQPSPVPPLPPGPGIVRLAHASLLVRSRTTSLLLDPIGLERFPSMETAPLDGLETDAVVITHGHGDHWHLPSVLHAAGERELPVICPRVPCVNLLTPLDFGRELALCGLDARTAAWGETIVVGDIEIDVLPFYGEQPTRDAPGPAPGLRNWGNCYRFNTPDYSAVVLADAGEDPLGSMEAAMADTVARRGPPTIVLACLRTFASPFFGGLASDWLTLPVYRLRELYQQHLQGRLPSTTAGPRGLARLCASADTLFFAPYANGYEGWRQPIHDIGWGEGEPSESEATGRFVAEGAAVGLRARALSWRCGDALVFRRGSLEAS